MTRDLLSILAMEGGGRGGGGLILKAEKKKTQSYHRRVNLGFVGCSVVLVSLRDKRERPIILDSAKYASSGFKICLAVTITN